jgi:hypothetical protein
VSNITPEDFAAGVQQALGKAPVKPAANPVRQPKSESAIDRTAIDSQPKSESEWTFEANPPYGGVAELAREKIRTLLAKRSLTQNQVQELINARSDVAKHAAALRQHENAQALHKLIPEFSPWLANFCGYHLILRNDGLLASMTAENEHRKSRTYSASAYLDHRIAELTMALDAMTPERRKEVEALVRGFRIGSR